MIYPGRKSHPWLSRYFRVLGVLAVLSALAYLGGTYVYPWLQAHRIVLNIIVISVVLMFIAAIVTAIITPIETNDDNLNPEDYYPL